MALALYRRYRPDTFDGVIGQDQVTVPLSRALDQGKITHAYLFSGPRGCGKTSSARILARCINCEKGPTSHPCGECQSCKDLATGGPGSIDVVEIDAASHNGVDDARELRERAGFAPARDRYKIFILDEAHMVTPQGFNALLKIVEEPPEHVMFIFATTEPDKVIGTIRSRTHHYPFRLVPPEVMGPYLEDICKKESINPAPGVLRLAMRAGAGSMRDTLSVLDQLMVGAVDGAISLDSAVALLGFTPSELISEAIDALIEHDGAAIYDVVRRVVVGGYDTRKFVEDLLGRVRDLLLMVSAGAKAASDLLNDIAPEDLETLQRQSSQMTLPNLARMAQTINEALSSMAGAVSPRMNLEILVARLLADSDITANVQGKSFIGAAKSQNKSFAQNTQDNSSVKETKHEESSESSAGSFDGSSSVASSESSSQSSPEASAESSNSVTKTQNNDSLSTDEMWDEVVAKLPEDAREYVTRKYVPKVQLNSEQSGRQRLVLTFNEPMSQHAFALAVCTTSPYDGQKVPKVVMSVVKDVFGNQVMIAPAPVASNGEAVESVARMDPKRLAQVKRDILLRKTGVSAGFIGKTTSDSGGFSENKKEKDSSDFLNADGSAASVVFENTAEDAKQEAALPDVEDDAWADMSSVPIADVMTLPNASTSALDVSTKTQSKPQVKMQSAQSNADGSNADGSRAAESSASDLGAVNPNSAESGASESKETMQVPVAPTSGASADECSMDDISLEAASSVDMDELKAMFEVKTVEEFAATDPKNPKNISANVKKKQEE
ncbi:DNA polymerase III subunit gamma/tau [Gardnerella greenwoodii]|uniref:DNA polymerase III subunit gamma/tau n=1 Tax=Gardnerella greenwoodii TaxID=2914925 RepID=UPI0003137B12|nr:DNA polymerase III subunit gamma/tau [Gardnerella greenwoodii]